MTAMNEDTEKATALDVLQSSELNARLLRRLTASPGVIDVQMLREIPARLMGLLAPLVSLFDELMARYGIDDGSMGNQPLVMEQPWMQNVNSYLTNYNSFSSTTNQFISIPPTEQKSRAEIEKMIDERAVTEVESRLHPSSLILPPDHSSSRAETFRIHRRPARRAWESDLTTAPAFDRKPVLKVADVSTAAASAAAPLKDEPASDKGEQPAVSETSGLKSGMANQAGVKVRAVKADEKIETAKVFTPFIAAASDLPLAQAQVQRKSQDNGAARVERRSNRITEDEHTSAKQSTDSDKETGMRSKDVSREIVAQSSLRSNLEGFDLVQGQAASSQLQKRATDFVWRRSADGSTVSDLTSVDSSSRLKAVADSSPQLPRGSQTITPESINRKSEHGAGSKVMTERIVRNISRKLLIERERRGY